jgi:hypothetical protein
MRDERTRAVATLEVPHDRGTSLAPAATLIVVALAESPDFPRIFATTPLLRISGAVVALVHLREVRHHDQ